MTRIDTPLEITSLRDEDPRPARYRPSGSTLPTRLAALLAIAAGVLAAAPSSAQPRAGGVRRLRVAGGDQPGLCRVGPRVVARRVAERLVLA